MLKLVDRINTYKHYEPLLKQLIIKDIKLKYHESAFNYGRNGDSVFQYV